MILAGTAFWIQLTASTDQTPVALDYLGRESLREDLPEIPGPPRSAERTLYDTLGGRSTVNGSTPNTNGAQPHSENRSTGSGASRQSGAELPLLPVHRSNHDVDAAAKVTDPQPLPRVREPVPQPERDRKKSGQQESNSAKESRLTKERESAKVAPEVDREKTIVPQKRTAEPKTEKRETPTPAIVGPAKKNVTPGGVAKRGKHDPDITPTPIGEFRYYAPEYYRGVYLNNGVVGAKKRYESLLDDCRKYGINTLVADVQPRFPSNEFIRTARERGFYLVARVVVFEGGLDQPTIPEKHLNRVLDAAEQAARSGFMEIQLDYIRFADKANIGNLSLKERYTTIAGILKMATDRLRPHGVRVGADIFGRIPFNENDRIGQRLEVFAAHLDTLYPMLYPSHFYGDPGYIRNPYKTIYDGQRKSVARLGERTRTIAYIQGFKMSVGGTGLSYHQYIRKQIEAAADSGGAGFVVWNARSSYGPFFEALADYDRTRQKKNTSAAATAE